MIEGKYSVKIYTDTFFDAIFIIILCALIIVLSKSKAGKDNICHAISLKSQDPK